MLTTALRIEPHIKKLMVLCTAVIVCSVFLYGFLLLEAVGHAASRSALERDIRALTSELGSLEARYLTETRRVTPELAATLGFVKPIETSVVFAAAEALSLNSLSQTLTEVR